MAEPGGSYSFKCSFLGFPPPKVKWFYGNKEIHDEGRFLIEFSEKESVLDIADIDPSDKGEYTCNISNEAGEESCGATLVVLSECYTFIT